MSAFHHGITANEATGGTLPIRDANTSTIGLIVTASDADATVFPLDTPVLVTSISRVLDKCGYDGTLRRSLEAMQRITSPTLVIVRVATDATADIIGTTSNGVRTGMQALLAAKSKLGIKPKILGAPELENPDVIQGLIAIAQKLRGFVYAAPRKADRSMMNMQEAVTYRDTLGARELMLILPELTAGNVLLKS